MSSESSSYLNQIEKNAEKPPLSIQEQLKMVELYGAKKSQVQIASALQRSRSGIRYAIQKYKGTGSTERRKGSGPKVMYDESIRDKILEYFRQKPTAYYNECIKDLKLNCSESFISKFLLSKGIQTYRAVKKPFLNEDHIAQRKYFHECYNDWTAEDWAKVIFTDEKTIMSHSNGRVFVKRPRGTALQPQYLDLQTRTNSFSINMWGCMIGIDNSFQIHLVDKKFKSTGYLELLKNKIFPMFATEFGNSFVFQQDNASIHTTDLVLEFFIQEDTDTLFWPPNSPDLSPIENLWAILQKRVNKRLKIQSVKNSEELFALADEEVKKIPTEMIQKLYQSMITRLKMLKENNYKQIKY